MSAFITFKKNKGRRINKKVINRKMNFGPTSLGFISVTLFSLLGLLYLAQSNQLSTKGYIIRELETKKNELVQENERLQVEAARLQAISYITEKAKDLKMEPAKKIDYLSSFGNVAKK